MTSRRQARRCVGTKTNGEPCPKYAMNGATVCDTHGGKAPQVRAKSAERLAEQAAQRVLARIDVEPCDNPLKVLAELTGQAIAWKDAMADKVNELNSLRYSTDGGEQLRAEIALWERALDRCGKFLVDMARLNIDERLVSIEERKANLIADAVKAALAELELPAEMQAQARTTVARHLRAVPGG